MKDIRLRDFPSFIRTTDINDTMLNYLMTESETMPRGSAIVLNTYDALEEYSVNPLIAINPRIFTVGPLHLMQQHVPNGQLKDIGSSLWKEDASCIQWLDTKDIGSVLFVNFGSITVMTKEQLTEFGWGLANSQKDFLWITRPDIVGGDEAMMPQEFIDETKGRGMVTSWCPQEQQHVPNGQLKDIGSSLWKEDASCIQWLDTKDIGSVLFVNFGSITVMTKEQLTEFGWGLANSQKDFLWITRPDIVGGDEAMMPQEFIDETKGRGMVTSWCPQEQVLKHPAIGGFLTHSGWNSTIESISYGVPVICWPFFAEQQTNCRYSCVEWEIGMEINTDVKRDEVESQVRELMDGVKGKMMKNKALEWKKKAEEAVAVGGSSYRNIDKLINDVLLKK
ncbi:7-deoxyloganetin glucosyltransferase [Artemisia annua]|uniref:7-deoxyloganetin glucosyltransferase n=1 Tax=Artemisia annua TaxID=35608 RepID=A0A2U1LDC5_ARTAN|nr:7-deoxyloganetin glucosyltransferase [Artemisia annua]